MRELLDQAEKIKAERDGLVEKQKSGINDHKAI